MKEGRGSRAALVARAARHWQAMVMLETIAVCSATGHLARKYPQERCAAKLSGFASIALWVSGLFRRLKEAPRNGGFFNASGARNIHAFCVPQESCLGVVFLTAPTIALARLWMSLLAEQVEADDFAAFFARGFVGFLRVARVGAVF